MNMRLRFCESKIYYWANRYMEYQTPKGRAREQEVIGFRDGIQERGYLTRYELYKVTDWILREHGEDAAEPTRNNADDHIMIATRQAFAARDNWEKLRHLPPLQGVGESVASAILHLYDERPYPILTHHALWSVGLERRQRSEHPFWPEYIVFCRDIADRNLVTMRTLDRALWRYSYDMEECLI